MGEPVSAMAGSTHGATGSFTPQVVLPSLDLSWPPGQLPFHSPHDGRLQQAFSRQLVFEPSAAAHTTTRALVQPLSPREISRVVARTAATPFGHIEVHMGLFFQTRRALAFPACASDAAALRRGAVITLAVAVSVTTAAWVVRSDLLKFVHDVRSI